MTDSRAIAGDLEAEGSVVGPYRLVREIGRGGMGVVFEAVHERAGQRAAVKLLAMDRRRDGATQVVRRFLNEARALSRVSHPWLVRLFDCGETESGGPWIAMEYVDGQVLRARIDALSAEGHGLPINEAVRVIRQLASAVGALHRAGVVHRDLKPENVMIVADEEAPFGQRVKLLDFGIAKLSGEGETVTTEGVVLGTAGYMAPEQCAGASGIDAQADVYALGVMLFELCTGARPFRGDAVSVMRKHLFAEPPAIEQMAPKLPRGLGALVRAMLAKEPSLRPNIDAVVERLRGVESTPSIAPAADPDPEDTIPPERPALRPRNEGDREPSATGPATVPESGQERGAVTGPTTEPNVTRDIPSLLPPTEPLPQAVLITATGPATVSVRPAVEVRRAESSLETGGPNSDKAPSGEGESAAAPGGRLSLSSRRRTFAIMAVCATAVGALAGLFQMRSPARTQAAVTLPGMVRIEGGTFRMGSTEDEIAAACATLPGGCAPEEMPQLHREKPAHDVTVSPFQIDAREVTNQEYVLFLEAIQPSLLVRDDADDHYPRFVTVRATGTLLFDLYPSASGIVRSEGGQFSAKPGWESRPMTLVTWDGASMYCRQQGKRLPTEAEWERAARGAKGRRFPWGDEPPRCDGVVFGRGDVRGCPDLPGEIADAGAAAQDVTPEGVRGMAGNVGEWVEDAFELPYYPDCGDCKDPVVKPPASGADDMRLFRGGTLYGNAWFVRATTRSRWKRTSVMNGLGLRCATR